MTDIANIFDPLTVEEKTPFDISRLMSRFEGRHQTDWTIPQAYLCVLLSAAYADGQVASEERSEIQALAIRSRTLKSLSKNELADLNSTIEARLNDRPEALLEACEALPQEMRLPLFAHCVDIVLADGELVKAEADFLNQLVQILNVDGDDARRIVEVLLLKNQY